MRSDYHRGYNKGYCAGRKGAWPEHAPPSPPDALIESLMAAAKALRDEADFICSIIEADDDFAVRLEPRIDAVDEALKAITRFAKEAESGT